MSRLTVLALMGLVPVALDAQEKTPQVLLVVREQVRPDSAQAYATNEAEIAATCVRLKCPHPYLALASLDGRREVWWLNAFASQREKERIDHAWARNASLTTRLQPLGKRKEQFREALTSTLATYRPDLSAGVTLRITG